MRKALVLTAMAVLASMTQPARAQFCPGVTPWVFDDVLVSDSFCGYITWMAQNGISLGCQVIDANHRLYCPSGTVTRAAMAAFMNRLGNIRVEAVGTGPGLTGGPITGIGTISLAATNLLPTTACATNQIARWNGSAWVCSSDANSGGTVTSVATGTGLTGGPITGSGTLSVASGYQLPQGCTNGQIPKSNGAGGWACAADDTIAASGGAVGQVLVGTGAAPAWSASPALGGNLGLSTSTASAGNVIKGGVRFLHDFGSANTFVGAGAGNFTMSGSANTAAGYIALQSVTTGFFNTALGAAALAGVTTGARNTAHGAYALASNAGGSYNTAVGDHALYFNTADSNTAVGYSALSANTSGQANTVVGALALTANSTGHDNTALGVRALFSNAGGFANTASGVSALESSTSGIANTAAGYQSQKFNTSGSFNTALGYQALTNGTVGNNNTALGASAGDLATGSGNLYLANRGLGGESDTIRIGSNGDVAGSHSRAFIAGVRGVTTGYGDAVAVVIDSAGQLGTLNSSRVVKDDVADMGDASDVLMQLRPVTFRYKAQAERGTLQYGLIAEEVAAVAPGLAATGRDGTVETVFYQYLAPMLLNEYQKQRRIVEAQALEIAELKESHAREIAELKRAVEVLLARTSPEGKVAAR